VVTLCLENRPELLAAYCGCSKVGAIASLINTNQRGESLIHSFNLNRGKVVIIGEECYEFFSEARSGIDLSRSTLCLVRDSGAISPKDITDITSELACKSIENPSTTPSVMLKDPVAYVYTSGTTGGLPKAAVIINKRAVSAMFWFGKVVMPVKPTDTIYIPCPFSIPTPSPSAGRRPCTAAPRWPCAENSAPASFWMTSGNSGDPFRLRGRGLPLPPWPYPPNRTIIRRRSKTSSATVCVPISGWHSRSASALRRFTNFTARPKA
jgi:hypothetical protein